MSPDSTYLGSVIFDNGPWEVLNRFTLVENLDTVVRFGSAFFFFFFLLVVVVVVEGGGECFTKPSKTLLQSSGKSGVGSLTMILI